MNQSATSVRNHCLSRVLAESVLVKHQLLVLNRSRKHAPNLRTTERIIAGLSALFMNAVRVLRSAIVLKPSTRLHLQLVPAKRKYRTIRWAASTKKSPRVLRQSLREMGR